jgi:hypothetical protein
VVLLWVLIGLVVIGLIAVVPRKRSWGPITYSRRSFVGGPFTGRVGEVILFAALIILVVLVIVH